MIVSNQNIDKYISNYQVIKIKEEIQIKEIKINIDSKEYSINIYQIYDNSKHKNAIYKEEFEAIIFIYDISNSESFLQLKDRIFEYNYNNSKKKFLNF